MSAYDSIIARLLALHPKRIDLSLDRMWRCSTRSAIRSGGCRRSSMSPAPTARARPSPSCARCWRRRAAACTSTPRRIWCASTSASGSARRAAARWSSDEALADALAECERANGGAPITVFEIETAAAFLLFSRHPADVLLLEVGLGGRLDATNVIETPLASVDHAGLDRPSRISRRHASRRSPPRRPASSSAACRRSIAPQTDAALAVIERQAERVRAPLRVAGEHWSVHGEHGRLVYQDDDGLLDLPPPKLLGRHQFDNAGTAIAALRARRPDAAARGVRERASPRPTGRRACSG